MAEAAVTGGKWLISKIFDTIRTKAVDELKDGDVVDRQIRVLLMKEIEQVKESLDALRDAHFDACKRNMKSAMDLIVRAEGDVKPVAIDELKLAKQNADHAFGLVPKTSEKIAAARFGLLAALVLNKDDLGDCQVFLHNYLDMVNTIPEVKESAKAKYGKSFGAKFKRFGFKTERDELLSLVTEFNKECEKCARKIGCYSLDRRICYGGNHYKDGLVADGLGLSLVKKTLLKTNCPGYAIAYANDIMYVGSFNELSITLYRLSDGNLDGDGFDIKISNDVGAIRYLHCTEHFLFALDNKYEVHILDIEDLKASKFTCIRKIKSVMYFMMHSFDGKIFYRQGKSIIRFNVDPLLENQTVELEQMKYDCTMTNYKEDLLVGSLGYGIVIIDSDAMNVKSTIETDCSKNLIIYDDFLYGSDWKDIYKVNVDNIKKVGENEEWISSMHVFKGFLFIAGENYVSVYSHIDLLQRYEINFPKLCSTPAYLYCMSKDEKWTLSRLDIELDDDENTKKA